MDEVFHYFNDADEKTLAIFDIDMVLVQPSDPAFQMPNIELHSAICKRITKNLPSHKLMLFLSLMTISSDSVLIDNRTPHLLEQLIQRNIPAMALTANLTGQVGKIHKMEKWRSNTLRQLGIDFTRCAPHERELVFDNLASFRGNFSTYLEGILFVNGTTVSKGEAFLSFLEKTGAMPSKVIFIDDREENLKSLEDAIQKLDRPIDYQGVHFLGAHKYPSLQISEGEFESRWKELAAQAMAID